MTQKTEEQLNLHQTSFSPEPDESIYCHSWSVMAEFMKDFRSSITAMESNMTMLDWSSKKQLHRQLQKERDLKAN